jgi:hypothetical protein
MKPEASLPHSQLPANRLYPEPAQSSPHPHIPTSLRSILLSSHLLRGLPSGLFHWGLYMNLPSTIRATYPAHFILLCFSFSSIGMDI